MMIFTFLILIRIALLVSPASAACFYPDGSVAQDTPCTDSTSQSTCCGTGFVCLGRSSSFFLCQATGDMLKSPGASEYVRGSCTDKTWRSSNCPNVCVDPKRDFVAGGNGVAACPNSAEKFYCISGGLGPENCTTNFNIIDFLTKPSPLTTVGRVASSSTSTATSSRSTPATTANTAPPGSSTQASTSTPASAGSTESAATVPSPPSSSNNSTTIGVGVGVSIGGLGLIAGAVATWLLVGRKRRSDRAPGDMAPVHQDLNHSDSTAYDSYKSPAYTYTVPVEAPTNEPVDRLYELPGWRGSRPPNS